MNRTILRKTIPRNKKRVNRTIPRKTTPPRKKEVVVLSEAVVLLEEWWSGRRRQWCLGGGDGDGLGGVVVWVAVTVTDWEAAKVWEAAIWEVMCSVNNFDRVLKR